MRGSTLLVEANPIQKQELESLLTNQKAVTPFIPESGWELEDILMTLTRVATKQNEQGTMERDTLKQWAISWSSDWINTNDYHSQ